MLQERVGRLVNKRPPRNLAPSGGGETLAMFNTGTTPLTANVLVDADSTRWTSLHGRCAAQLLKRNPSFKMLLRSGLHPVNYARSELLSLPGLERIPGLKSLVEAQRLDREYLRAGREELRR